MVSPAHFDLGFLCAFSQDYNFNKLINQIQTYLILLHFTLLCFADISFFTNRKFVATLHQASLPAPFFQQRLLPSCLWHILVILPELKVEPEDVTQLLRSHDQTLS